jgi:hypothetical protein
MKDAQTSRESTSPVLRPDKIIDGATKREDCFHTFSKMNNNIKNKLMHSVSAEAGITYRDEKEKTEQLSFERVEFCVNAQAEK